MKKLRKVIQGLNKTEDFIVLLVLLLVFCIGLFALYDSYLVYQDANDTSVLKYKPGYQGETPDKPIVGNMAGWITLKNTKVDYPVMQGETNEEYLTKNPFGEYAMSGSLFLDYRNNPNFTDDYNLVYGHHMDGGLMFGALDKYLQKPYFKKHQKGTLIVGNNKQSKTSVKQNTHKIKVFAVLESDATNGIFFVPNSHSKSEIISYVKTHSLILDDDVLSTMADEDKLIAFSTCKYPTTVERIMVFAIIK